VIDADTPAVQTVDVTKVYRVGRMDYPALKGINLNIGKGEFVSITGSSGSGKSTLLNLIGAFVGLVLGFVLSFAIGGQLGGGLIGGRGFGGGFGGGGGSQASHPTFTTGLIVFALVVPIGLSVVAGLHPAWRTSRMNAVLALKYE
jgi:hypothetical protein